MKLDLDFIVGTTLVVCAVAVTTAVLYRQFVTPLDVNQIERPTFVASWHKVFATGRHVGATAARVQIIEFSDFECPYCAQFHKTLLVVRSRFPQQIGVAYLHYPLPGHRFAVPAARAAECAAAQGLYEAMRDQLFANQDDFGLKPWKDFAAAAGVPDLMAFASCVRSTDAIPAVEQGKALGKELSVKGTPTIVINGWKLGRPPNVSELENMVRLILAGKSPITQD